MSEVGKGQEEIVEDDYIPEIMRAGEIYDRALWRCERQLGLELSEHEKIDLANRVKKVERMYDDGFFRDSRYLDMEALIPFMLENFGMDISNPEKLMKLFHGIELKEIGAYLRRHQSENQIP